MALGFNTTGDLPTATTDGVDLNQVWADYQRTVDLRNAERSALVRLLTYDVTTSFEQIAGTGTPNDFEEATEFGEPKGIRVSATPVVRGYPHKWYDLAARYTWQFLLDASAADLDRIHNAALEADNRLLYRQVMEALFSPTATSATNKEGQNVYSFWNGNADGFGEVPPTWKTNTFTNTHNHYLASNAGVAYVPGSTTGNGRIDSGDVEAMYEHLRHHGYGVDQGYKVILLANSADTASIRTFRAGVANANSATALYDFIPAANQSGLILPLTSQLVNGQATGNEVPGFNVIGTYGNVLIVEEDMVPQGYVAMYSTGGPENLANPIAIRHHPRMQNLQLVKGRVPDYPLVDSFYVHGLGVGVRNRGQAVMMQIVNSASYTEPTITV